jgi:benzoyl-CoA reductase/2-hydroxyglutaryl-CoA dehydratase subunit BcrC/BadD/HgdB
MNSLFQKYREEIELYSSGGRGGVPKSDRYRPFVGIFCPYTVEELIDAAGFQPVRLIPRKTEIRRADAYMPNNICSYLRHILDAGLSGELEDFRCIVFNHSCDGSRRTKDVFGAYLKNIETVFVDLPKKRDELSIQYFTGQLKGFRTFLEELRGEAISDSAISDSISRYNENRRLMLKLYEAIAAPVSPLSAEEIDIILELNATLSKARANKLLLETMELVEANGRSLTKGDPPRKVDAKRIFLSGNVFNALPLTKFLEACGGQVVGDDFCFGGRYSQVAVAEGVEPLRALAEGYLNRVPCGRMENYDERFQFLLDEMGRKKAQGLIYTSLKFCDNFLIDYPSLKKVLEARDIPSLFLEGEYFSFGGGQVKTRVEAFLELL